MDSETKVKALIQRQYGARPDLRLINLPTGGFWQGTKIRQTAGEVTLRDARFYKFGKPGFPDMLAAHSVIITPAMVGQKIAQFVGIETKRLDGEAKQHQLECHELLRSLGAVVIVAYTPDDMAQLFEER